MLDIEESVISLVFSRDDEQLVLIHLTLLDSAKPATKPSTEFVITTTPSLISL